MSQVTSGFRLFLIVGLSGPLLLSAAGCSDTRISVDRLQVLEAELAEHEPVPVPANAFALAEVQRLRARPGDVLRVTLIGLGDDLAPMTLQARVDDAGNIELPMVGALRVAGLDLARIEDAIHDAYVPDYKTDLTAHVEIADPATITVIVNGAAGQRGLVTLRSDRRNLLYALVQSEGFIKSASGVVHVRPARPQRPSATYDLNDVNDLRRAMLSPPLESGDMITVEAGTPAAIYLTGLVNAPGPIVIEPGAQLTVMQAIAAGSGLVDALEPKEATLWRTLRDGRRVRVKLELADIRAGDAADVALRAGDILDVPHTAETRLRQWFVNNIQIGPFGVQGVYDPVADYRARILRDDDDGGGVFRRLFSDALQTSILSQTLNPAAVP